ncbi:MAG: NYN domain-containing protein [Candidatus Njordarchaeales archaeon]
MVQETAVSVLIDFDLVHDVLTARMVLEKASKFGKIIKARVYVEQSEINAHREGLFEMSKLGIEPVVTMLAKDVRFAIDLLDDAYNDKITHIIVVHNKESILPALMYAKTLKKIIVISPERVPKSYEAVVEEIITI